MTGMKAVVGLSLSSVLGFTALIVGCVMPEHKSFWPLFVVVFYILSPMPTALARRLSYDSTTTSSSMEFAIFITTGIVMSALLLPAVLAHAGIIAVSAFVFSTLASTLIFGTIVAYFYYNSEDNGWGAPLY